jgi:hypothetical protein
VGVSVPGRAMVVQRAQGPDAYAVVHDAFATAARRLREHRRRR